MLLLWLSLLGFCGRGDVCSCVDFLLSLSLISRIENGWSWTAHVILIDREALVLVHLRRLLIHHNRRGRPSHATDATLIHRVVAHLLLLLVLRDANATELLLLSLSEG